MNKNDFELLIEKCWKELEKGKSLKDILADNPAQAERLEPLLQSILMALSLPKPEASKSAVHQGKNSLLSEIEDLRNKDHFLKNGTNRRNLRYSRRWFNNIRNLLVGQENSDMKLLPRLAIYMLVTIMAAGFFTVSASASSLPGDPLYGLKLNWEQTQLAFAFSDESRLELEVEFKLERRFEVEALLSEGREEDVEFYGVIEEQGTSSWVISGVTVSVGPETEIKGTLEIGDLVKVEAVIQQDGSLFALEIYLDIDGSSDDDLDDESDDDLDDDSDDDLDDDSDDDLDDDSDDDLDDDSDDDLDDDSDDDLDDDSDDDLEEVEFSGLVEAMGEFTWIIDGITVNIGPETDIEDDVEVGDFVEVESEIQADGSLLALEIELDDDDDDSDHDDDDDDDSDHDD